MRGLFVWRGFARLVCLLVVAFVSACGGGGGDGGGGNGDGAFTLGASSATFATLAGNLPPQQEFAFTVTSPANVAGVGAAFPASEGVPPWLDVSISGSMPNFMVRLQV